MAVGLKEPKDLLAIKGVSLSVAEAGIRYQNRDDIVLIKLADTATVAGVFTKNRYCAAPVVIAKQHMADAKPRALLINSGNANAGTGQAGMLSAKQSCEAVAQELGLSVNQVLPFSTGVIGEAMPTGKVLQAIPSLSSSLDETNWLSAARAIMTTDTVPKAVSETLVIDGTPVTLTGMAKGSGMICPNMATMLAYIACDTAIEQTVLDAMLHRATDASFNRITVDSDTSTNDALILIASGTSDLATIDDVESGHAQLLYQALEKLAIELATSVVRDGEGASKFVKIAVNGASNKKDASAIAYSVAHSPLVKTALFASDPNWGRILAAVGKAEVSALDLDKVDLQINGLSLIEQGEPAPDYTEELGKAEFLKEEITISIELNLASGSHHVWTTDLSHDYVSINADYRS